MRERERGESDSAAADRDVENDMQEQTVSDVGKCGTRIGLEREEKKEREGV